MGGVGDAGDGGVTDRGADRTGRHRAGAQRGAAATEVRPRARSRARPVDVDGTDAPLFTRAVFDYAAHRPGQPLTMLQAGCATAGGDPDVARLRAAGLHVAVSLVDDDTVAARAAVAARPELASCVLGDLRSAPLAPRSFDVVHCEHLLERIGNAELVLDRIVESLKPGGLLLLSTADRDCAAGFLDRRLPRSMRATVWRRQRPGEPGPYPAVYEYVVSGRGIHSYALRRGLVMARREAPNPAPGVRRPRELVLACNLVARLSGGRLTSAHEELRYVIRKPESGYLRVL
jgi:SAM-dependent methyltransferase